MPHTCASPSCPNAKEGPVDGVAAFGVALATQRCGGCQRVWYCDRGCQKAHWKAHKTDCRKTPEEVARDSDSGALLSFVLGSRDFVSAMTLMVDAMDVIVARMMAEQGVAVQASGFLTVVRVWKKGDAKTIIERSGGTEVVASSGLALAELFAKRDLALWSVIEECDYEIRLNGTVFLPPGVEVKTLETELGALELDQGVQLPPKLVELIAKCVTIKEHSRAVRALTEDPAFASNCQLRRNITEGANGTAVRGYHKIYTEAVRECGGSEPGDFEGRHVAVSLCLETPVDEPTPIIKSEMCSSSFVMRDAVGEDGAAGPA